MWLWNSVYFPLHVGRSSTILVLLALMLPPQVESAGRFSITPTRIVYVGEGQTVSLKWEYIIDSGDTFDGLIWTSFDPPGSSSVTDQFRLAVRDKENRSFILPDKSTNPPNLKGVSLYEGRVKIKDQSTLEITNVTLDNTYIVSLIYNDSGNGTALLSSEPVAVIPTVPPRIASNSFISPLDVIEGNDAIIYCSATGKPAPNVTWTKSMSGEKLNQSVSSTLLVIKNIRRDSNKNFTCTASSVGNIAFKNLKLNVVYKPDIIDYESNSTVGSWNGNKLTFHCAAKGEPPAEFQWYKPDGQQITSKVFIMKGSSTVTLETLSGDYGQYKCRANNTVGFREHNITVIEWVKPSEPKITVTEDDIEVSYITLRWTAPRYNGGSKVIDYKVIVNGDDKQRTVSGVTGTQTLINRLKPRWSYTFVLSARNVVGYSKSVSRTFTTKIKGTPGLSTIQNTETEAPSERITLTWSAARENGAKILTYQVWWRLVDSTGRVSQWSVRNTSSDALSFTVTWLKFGKTYDFGVTAWNMYGQSALDKDKGLKRIRVVQEYPSVTSSHDKISCSYTVVFGGLFGVMVIFNLMQMSCINWLRRNIKVEKDKRFT